MQRAIERVVGRECVGQRCKAVLFDFDGTISLLRSGWRDVMISMFVRELNAVAEAPEPAVLDAVVADSVDELTGHQTIYQMIRLAELVDEYGGAALDPLEYKHRYHELLEQTVSRRREELRQGVKPAIYLVRGAGGVLEQLRSAGVRCYLASGTDIQYVVSEAELLGVAAYFDEIHGAINEYWRFSKGRVLDEIIARSGGRPGDVVVIGDGRVEMDEASKRGCLAIGVASDEMGGRSINEWKRERLIKAGAAMIVRDLRAVAVLIRSSLRSLL